MTHHLLKLISEGLTAAVGINGAPILIDPSGAGLNGTMPANPWLKPKGNTLSIALAKPAPPPGVSLPEPNCRAEIYSVKPNSPAGEPDRFLARFEKKPKDRVPVPIMTEVPFEISAPPPTRLWTEAAKLDELASADKQELRILVQKFADAIQNRALDAISGLLNYKTRDCALASGQDPEHMHQVIRELYSQRMFTEPSLKIEGGQATELHFKLIASGQAVWLFQSLAKPALVVVTPNKRFTLAVFAAKVGGLWRIVR